MKQFLHRSEQSRNEFETTLTSIIIHCRKSEKFIFNYHDDTFAV
jgi:hypothetical protein